MDGNMSLDSSFSRNYECNILTELPAITGDHYYYPSGSKTGGKDGLMIKFTSSDGSSWIGTFSWGTRTTKGVKTGIFTYPDPNKVCVVACGIAFVVDVSDPRKFKEINVFPVTSVVSIPARGILVLSSQTKLYAYGASGLVWETKRLAWDELKITDVGDDELKGMVWDIQSEEYIPFHVDLESGHHIGGIAENKGVDKGVKPI